MLSLNFDNLSANLTNKFGLHYFFLFSVSEHILTVTESVGKTSASLFSVSEQILTVTESVGKPSAYSETIKDGSTYSSITQCEGT